ncbi:RimJ/RimL family protein N-acetyltransferase [Loktanella sp. PT4BL]|jgi:RimJ/RimL family protein N-acetyltransferase|uniref:GNAT family N-acetyltransferase n=1 Tax=Loktanella sp. PT4BL TaxID=2135611 RepID=UPI000D86CF66|nr:GNAT family protein [Loktanella sp. PT4BL]PXW71025.1 RimJ/RimL family protein N-acetyltransferase [Loktanella sp. PT4BL]
MVLKLMRRKEPPDPYLCKPIITDRFNLVNCTRQQAIKSTAPWRTDSEILHNLMMPKAAYTDFQWVKVIGRPDGHSRFFHAIVAKEIKGTIGTHRVTIDRSGNASLALVIHARSWWGKDVFEEVRTGIMDHFSASDRVVRFQGRVLSRNFSSIYNYNKMGFRMIGYDRKAWLSPVTDEHCDTIYYEMLAEDWQKKRNGQDKTDAQ